MSADYIWKPIEPHSDVERQIDLIALRPLYENWRASRKQIQQSSQTQLAEFNQRLIRRLSVETGILERLYDLDRGTTEALVAHGFAGAPNIDWVKRVAYVEPTEQAGRSRWLGPGQPLRFRYCQAIKEVLLTDEPSEHYSRRAVEEMESAREAFAFLSRDATTVLTSKSEGKTYWWTFAGLRVNAALSDAIRGQFGIETSADNLAIKIEGLCRSIGMESIHEALQKNPPKYGSSIEVAKALEDLKFGACLPVSLAKSMFSVRLSDPEVVAHTVNQPLRLVTVP